MHKLITVIGAVVLTTAASEALAEASVGGRTGPYVRGDMFVSFMNMNDLGSGYSYKDDKWDQEFTRPGLSFGGGYDFGSFRSDVVFDYRRGKDLGKDLRPAAAHYPHVEADIIAYSIMANGYWDIVEIGLSQGFGESEMTLTPYVGAGFGGVVLDTDTAWTDAYGGQGDASHERHNLTWALMAGVAVHVTESVAVDAGWRYQDLGPLRTSQFVFTDLTSHDLRLGLRYGF